MLQNYQHHASSYRDPSGFIFEKDGVLYRQVNKCFKEDFDYFVGSGCYDSFIKKNLLIPHREINENLTGSAAWYKTLQPEPIKFISYSYEWSFDMLKDAALLTLQLLKEAIGFGLILKDATPYNIQWHNGKLIFIDTLSFEKYKEEEPWIAYRQFCECFLSPLLLMHYSKQPLQQMQLAFPEGIPLAVTKSLLPWKSKFSLHTYLHIHLHAKVSSKNKTNTQQQAKFSKQKLLNLISSLETLVTKLKRSAQQTAWSEYYDEASQRDNYVEKKKQLINDWTGQLQGIKTAADLGTNDGEFSKLIAEKGIFTLATDFDPVCINRLYKEIKQTTIQPLIIDLSNPSPAIGVNNTERSSFISRTKVDLAMGLALIHHLSIGKNIPFDKIASLFHQLTTYLIIEFVPKEDEKVQLMLKSKKDIYTGYTEEDFKLIFLNYFSIEKAEKIGTSNRTLFLMRKK